MGSLIGSHAFIRENQNQKFRDVDLGQNNWNNLKGYFLLSLLLFFLSIFTSFNSFLFFLGLSGEEARDQILRTNPELQVHIVPHVRHFLL